LPAQKEELCQLLLGKGKKKTRIFQEGRKRDEELPQTAEGLAFGQNQMQEKAYRHGLDLHKQKLAWYARKRSRGKKEP